MHTLPFISIILLFIQQQSILSSNDQDIQTYILKNYGNQNFPGNEGLSMQFAVSFFGVTQVDTIQGIISVSCFLKLYWTDPFNCAVVIKWDPSSFGNVETISIRADQELIWLPDVVMYENAEKPFEQLMQEFSVLRVSYDGSIYWSRPGVLLIKHQFDLEGYPYDIQKIYMTFGSWLYTTDRVEFKTHSGGHSLLTGHLYSNNVEWKLNSLDWVDNRDEWPQGAFDSVVISLTIQRNGNIVMNFLILPSLFCGIILMNYYFLPIDSNDRLSFLLTMILSVVLLILVMFEKLPMNNQSMLAKQMFDVIVFSSFGVFGWVAIIGAIFKIRYTQYKRIKRQLLQKGFTSKNHKAKPKDLFYAELMEKFDRLLEKLNPNGVVKDQRQRKIQISSVSQDEEEENLKITNQLESSSVKAIVPESERTSMVPNQKQLLTPVPFIDTVSFIKYFLGIKKVTLFPLQTQRVIYKKMFRLLKFIDFGAVVIVFSIFAIYIFIIFIKLKKDFM